ncbi:hypothetical protein [Krasilnikovia cinnamomea]|uniref:hypothetical protein n=1 Tax=Krasilnikovia cinnamomea TaxID=349313 RepID=UPI00102BCDD3|nr:hypothetical protein [Krasilnikovia cinnamomea]
MQVALGRWAVTGWRRNLPQPGDTVTIKEADYCYGQGDIRLRLTAVGDGGQVPEGAEWVEVHGVELTSDGRARGPRYALVRASALRR